MRVVVFGAGLIGVASAYYLWRDGHEVEVIEALDRPAGVTSQANACLVSSSRALPWPTPTAHRTAWRALTESGAPMRVTHPFDPALWRWGLEFLRYARQDEFERLSRAKLGFARFCQDELESTLAATGVDCGYRRDGLLYVCRCDGTLVSARTRATLVGEHGYDVRVLTRAEVLAFEPALGDSPIVGGTLAVSDAQGDSRVFTERLADWLAAQPDRPVRFSYGEHVTATPMQRGQNLVFASARRTLTADAFVVALGPQTPAFARAFGRRVPIYPVKGFSMTVPVRDLARAPVRGGICEDSLIAWCPLASGDGPRMRITTGAIFSGQDDGFVADDFRAHREQFETLFPGALAWDDPRTSYWACQRPMTPSSLPILQRDPQHAGLFWNCGQGHIGWTMSCGSGRVIADLVAGRSSAFPLADMHQL